MPLRRAGPHLVLGAGRLAKLALRCQKPPSLPRAALAASQKRVAPTKPNLLVTEGDAARVVVKIAVVAAIPIDPPNAAVTAPTNARMTVLAIV